MREIAEGVTKSSRASCSLEYRRVMPLMSNDSGLAAMASAVLKKTMGEDAVTAGYPSNMGCGEFSVFPDHVPGIFMLIGSREPGQPVVEIHNPGFLFPLECLPAGVRALCETALEFTCTER